ncbi:hypothetical protein [Oleiagrimonas soli]|uniref:Energy-converting hydrogenase Eha subunit H n=2 Tax=Oleiagrimonas soli TaxID=1543381 RepID=A0A841KSJ6_9GAMM|nr:hypothetical protein [Oleiagrimonas soli]MBB6185631.1 energy-converting hydrogenase Eha subunit H [Oleiagrimonas soli]
MGRSMPENTHSTSLLTLLFSTFSAAMIALAAGALWLLLDLFAPQLQATVWLALPLGLLLGHVMRHWVIDASWPAAVLAVLATLVACGYMRFLLAAADLAGTFGMTYMQSLHRAGSGMLAHLAWISLSPGAIAVYLVAAALAGFLAWRGSLRGKTA